MNTNLTLSNGQTIDLGNGLVAFCHNDHVISIGSSTVSTPILSEPAPLAATAAAQPAENHRHLRRMVARLPRENGVSAQGLRSLRTCWTLINQNGEFYVPGGAWTRDPAEARLLTRGEAERRANMIQGRGGPHRRCRVVRLDQRAGELVRVPVRPRV